MTEKSWDVPVIPLSALKYTMLNSKPSELEKQRVGQDVQNILHLKFYSTLPFFGETLEN